MRPRGTGEGGEVGGRGEGGRRRPHGAKHCVIYLQGCSTAAGVWGRDPTHLQTSDEDEPMQRCITGRFGRDRSCLELLGIGLPALKQQGFLTISSTLKTHTLLVCWIMILFN